MLVNKRFELMNILRVCFVLMSLLMLSGCIYLDIACQDTAVPLYPKRISGSMHLTNGVDISHTYYTNTVDEQEPDDLDQDLIPAVKAVVGISPRTDIVFNYAYNNGHGRSTYSGDYRSYNHDSSHTKLGIKYLLSQKEKTYISVLPSLYIANGQISGLRMDDSNFRYKYDLWGMEGQLLLTHQTSQHISATLAARAQFNNIEKTLDGSHYGPYFTANYGVRGNFRFSASIFHLTPELGLEVLPIVNGETVVTTIGSLGFGVQF